MNVIEVEDMKRLPRFFEAFTDRTFGGCGCGRV